MRDHTKFFRYPFRKRAIRQAEPIRRSPPAICYYADILRHFFEKAYAYPMEMCDPWELEADI